MCIKKAYIYQMIRVISFSILPFICAPVSHHYLSPLSSFPLPVFSFTVHCFLSLFLSLRTWSSFAPLSRSARARLSIDCRTTSLTSPTPPEGQESAGWIFPPPPAQFPLFFPCDAVRRDATRRDATQCGQHPSTATPRIALALAVVDSYTRLIDELFLPCE